MSANINSNKVSHFGLYILLPLSFYILFTFNIFGNSVRIGISDAIIIILFLYILIKDHELLVNSVKFYPIVVWVLLLISLWVAISFLIGWHNTYSIQPWSLFNKLIGWFLLVGYFISGLWLGHKENSTFNFIVAFILLAWIFAAYALLVHWFYVSNIKTFVPASYFNRTQALFQNPNAYGIITGVVVLYQLSLWDELKKRFPQWLLYFGIALLFLVIFYGRSRSAWLGLLLGVVFLLFYQKQTLKLIFLGIVCALMLNLAIFYTPAIVNQIAPKENIIPEPKYKRLYALHSYTHKKDYGIEARIQQIKTSMEYWIDSPVFGIGLGTYLHKSTQDGKNPDGYTLHNSAVWVLAELGLVGVLLFLTFFYKIFQIHYRSFKRGYLYSLPTMAMLVLMFGASQGTEILYQRYFWFLLGLMTMGSWAISNVIAEQKAINQSL